MCYIGIIAFKYWFCKWVVIIFKAVKLERQKMKKAEELAKKILTDQLSNETNTFSPEQPKGGIHEQLDHKNHNHRPGNSIPTNTDKPGVATCCPRD
jgi:hypothetical protein